MAAQAPLTHTSAWKFSSSSLAHVTPVPHPLDISHLAKIFPHTQLLPPSGLLGFYAQLASELLDSLWRPQLIWLFELNSQHFLLFLSLPPVLTQGWSCQSVGNLIQYATWPKWAKRSLSSFLQLSVLISHIIPSQVKALDYSFYLALDHHAPKNIHMERMATPSLGTVKFSRSISLGYTTSLGAVPGWQITNERFKTRK